MKLRIFFQMSITHIQRERQRTLFVLFCIAAGVAAVVSLRSLGLMIQTTLSGNLQAANRADIVIELSKEAYQNEEALLPDGSKRRVNQSLFIVDGNPSFSSASIRVSHSGDKQIRHWAAAHDFEISPAWTNYGPFMHIHALGTDTRATSATVRFVDPENYPFYGELLALEPTGQPISEALAYSKDSSVIYPIVISQSLHDETGFQVGDQVYLSGSPQPFRVAAIVSTESESTPADIFGGAFPFFIAPYQAAERIFHKTPNMYYIKAPSGTDIKTASEELLYQFPGLEITTIEDISRINASFGRETTRLITVMGLVSLLIGGVGIINTMTVVISRRNLEIAVLKTIGAQRKDILLMFFVETTILGLIGSFLGILLGLCLVLILQNFAERFVFSAIQFAIYLEPLWMGLTLGILMTLTFGLLPILAASQVRPNAVLNPQDTVIPQAGRITSFLVGMGITTMMGSIVGVILNNQVLGFVLAFGTLVILVVITLILHSIVWIFTRLPSFGNISLKLVQRALNAHKHRAANTMLTLVIGMFSLSLVIVLAQGTLKSLATSAEEFIGGNVLIAVNSLDAGQTLERKAAQLPGVIAYEHDVTYTAEIVAINGDRDIEARAQAAKGTSDASDTSIGGNVARTVDTYVESFEMKVLSEDTWEYTITQGEDVVGKTDSGYILLEPSVYNEVIDWFGLKPGDTLTLRFPSGAKREAQIAGITERHDSGLLAVSNFRESDAIVQAHFIPRGEQPIPSMYALTVREDQMSETLQALSEVQGTFVITIDQMMVGTKRMLDQMAPLPLIVAALSLFASSAIIANTVSLATMERRRQIGIMKALGLQAARVLWLLLLENGLIGLLGGILGITLGAVILVVSGLLYQSSDLPVGVLTGLTAVSVGLTLIATMISAYGASREKPLNVLRYE